MAKFGFIFKKCSLPIDSSSYIFMCFLQNFRFFFKMEVMKKYGKIRLFMIKDSSLPCKASNLLLLMSDISHILPSSVIAADIEW